jgi:hypothetical protein
MPFSERVAIAVQLAIQARIFFDLWWLYEGPTREGNLENLNVYPEFFRFDSHAHFVSYIVHIAALFESRSNTINVPLLVDEAEHNGIYKGTVNKLRKQLSSSDDLIKKAIILRSNLFAHRSPALTYAEIFRLAEVNADQLRSLADLSFSVLGTIADDLGVQSPFVNDIASEHLQGLIDEIR